VHGQDSNTHVFVIKRFVFGGIEMGLLVSCCLRLMGYDNVGGAAAAEASQRKRQLSSILAERDNPDVDGRKHETLSRYATYSPQTACIEIHPYRHITMENGNRV